MLVFISYITFPYSKEKKEAEAFYHNDYLKIKVKTAVTHDVEHFIIKP